MLSQCEFVSFSSFGWTCLYVWTLKRVNIKTGPHCIVCKKSANGSYRNDVFKLHGSVANMVFARCVGKCEECTNTKILFMLFFVPFAYTLLWDKIIDKNSYFVFLMIWTFRKILIYCFICVMLLAYTIQRRVYLSIRYINFRTLNKLLIDGSPCSENEQIRFKYLSICDRYIMVIPENTLDIFF